MEFDYQPHLVGRLVAIRPLQRDDYDELFAAASDPLIWELHPDDRYRPDVFKEFFEAHLASGGAVLITDASTGDVIGTSRFDSTHTGDDAVEIGWTFLIRSHWGGETNREVKDLMLRHAFQYVDTVLFFVDPGNGRSQAALSKIGATHEDASDYERPGCSEVFRIRREDFS